MLESGGQHGQALAPKTVRNCHIVLHRALSDAERLGIASRNVAHAAKAPVAMRKEMATWTAEELARFLELVGDDRLYAAYVILATTGMRRGEVLGLRWSDVDVDARRLSVAQTLTTINDQVFLGADEDAAQPAKRRRSTPETVAALRAHRSRQQRGAAGGRRLPDRVGTGSCSQRWTGRRSIRTGSLPRSSGMCVMAASRSYSGPHGLRHTWATLALQAGVHPKVVSDQLGHTSDNGDHRHVQPRGAEPRCWRGRHRRGADLWNRKQRSGGLLRCG